MGREDLRPDTPVYPVSRLVLMIKTSLEYTFPEVRVRGEISNFLRYSSGHLYFDLKDDQGKIRCVMFRSQADRVWVSGYDGLERYREGVRVYRSDKPFYSLLQQREPPYTLWLGSEGQGLYTLRLGEERPRPFRPRKGSLPGALVYSLLQSRDGFLWIGTNQGLSRLTSPPG